MNYPKKIISTCLVLISFLVFAPNINSQTSNDTSVGITINPSVIEQTIEPGGVRKSSISIINDSQSILPIRALVKPLTPVEEEISLRDSINFDASQWITISAEYFFLKPNQTKNIDVIVQVPESAEPGGRYATVLFEVLVEVKDDQNPTLSSATQVGAIAMITVKGEINELLSLTNNRMVSMVEFAPLIELKTELANLGNIHSLPHINFVVRNIMGRVVYDTNLPVKIVLPNTTRPFSDKWYQPLRFGLYELETTISYGTKTSTKSKTERFVIVPGYHLIGLVFIVLVATLFLQKRKQLKNAWAIIIGK